MVEDGSNPEANSMPGPGRFPSVVSWFDYVRAEGYNVPVQVPHGVSLAGGHLGLSPQEAFDWLKERWLLFERNGMVAFDVRVTRPDFWEAVRDAGGEYDPTSNA